MCDPYRTSARVVACRDDKQDHGHMPVTNRVRTVALAMTLIIAGAALVCAQEVQMVDMVNHPPHYANLDPEPIDVIESWELGFHRGQVVKYVARAGKKDPAKTVEDLKKARFYLNRLIAIEEGVP